jgi:hypothetical protein
MRARTLMTAALLSLTLAACGPSATAPASSPAPAAPAADPVAVCKAFFARQVTCKAQFIPALVDLRIRLDRPAGIAARAKAEGRDALIAIAHKEFETDGTNAQRTASCEQMALKAPPQAMAPLKACVDAKTCDEYSTCAMPLIQARMGDK